MIPGELPDEHWVQDTPELSYTITTAGRVALARAQDCHRAAPLPLHRTEAGYPRCATCDGGGCPDCTDPA